MFAFSLPASRSFSRATGTKIGQSYTGHFMVMTQPMTAAEFKAKCLDVLDQVAESGNGIAVAQRAPAVAQAVQLVTKPVTLLGPMKGVGRSRPTPFLRERVTGLTTSH